MKNYRILLFIIASFLLLSNRGGKAQDQDSLMFGDAGFTLTSHVVATSMFHWYTSYSGQLSGPWIPLEGRENWTGEVDFWKRMIKQTMAANIDVLYVHLIPHMEQQRVNLFQALYELRREGWDVPKVCPFLDPIITCNIIGHDIDVSTDAGKDELAQQYIRFFEQYYSVNTDQFADDYIYTIDDQVVLDIWHVHLNITNYDKLTRNDMEIRLEDALGLDHPVFYNGIRMITTAISPTFGFADEKVHQFEVHEYYIESLYNGILSVQLKAGYWDQNIRDPGYQLPRYGGWKYKDAWSNVDASINRIYIESFNEYDEGSGIYAARTDTIYKTGINENTDTWSNDDDPYEYINATAAGAADFNDDPLLGAKIIWQNIPLNMMPGDTFIAKILVRNTGNARWSNAENFKFGEQEAVDPVLFGPARYLINDTLDEIPEYGGIFRGRVKTFNIEVIAPDTNGIFITHWGMLQEGVSWFGDILEITIAVGEDYVFRKDLTTTNDEIFHISPNPAPQGGDVRLTGPFRKDDRLVIVDLKGKEIFNYLFPEGKESLHFNPASLNMPPGMYIIRTTRGRRGYASKVVIQ